MFDVGFSELMVIAVVALVVIGPERLPAVARTLGHLFGRLQRYVNDVKADISREIELDELKKFKSQFEEAAQSVESSVRAEVSGAEATFNSIAADLNPGEPGAAEALASSAEAVPAGAGAPATVAAEEGVLAAARPEGAVEAAAAHAAALPPASEHKTAA